MNHSSNAYALISGASQGLGKALALELASRSCNLLLVSLKNEGLEALSAQIRREFGVDVQYFEADFCEQNAVYDIARWARKKFPVFMLVNNAGIGGTKAFEKASPEYMDRIIQVNVRASTLLTRLMLPELRQHPRAYILNVSSMASFSPLPFKTVYPASKAFVSVFSQSLKAELRNSNVKVSVIHPGPLPTNPDVKERIARLGRLGQMGLLSPERLARLSIDRLLNGQFRLIPGLMNKVNRFLLAMVPDVVKLPLLCRLMQRELGEQSFHIQSKPLNLN